MLTAHRSAEDVADISHASGSVPAPRVAPQSDLGADRTAPTQPMVGTFATGGMVQATPWLDESGCAYVLPRRET